MPSATVRVSRETLQVLRELAQQLDEPMPKILAVAVEAYRRKKILDQSNLAYEALRSDPEAWPEEQKERQAWEATLEDGLDDL